MTNIELYAKRDQFFSTVDSFPIFVATAVLVVAFFPVFFFLCSRCCSLSVINTPFFELISRTQGKNSKVLKANSFMAIIY